MYEIFVNSMIERLYDRNYGYYEPSFFRMHLNTKEKIERIENLTPSVFATLCHEYIHFMQDITSIYGLGNIYNVVQFIKYSTNYIYKTGKSFSVPIILDTSIITGSMIAFSKEIERITLGDTEPFSNVRIIKKPTPNSMPISGHLGMTKVPVIDIEININNQLGTEFYSFGAMCIMESMAYILERKLSGVDDQLPDLPYNSAKLVADIFYPKFSRNEYRLLALCDISLNSSNPAYTFVELLKEWKERKFLPHNACDLYDDFYKRQYELSEETAASITKNHVTFLPEFEKYIKLVRESLHSYVKIEDQTVTNEFTTRACLINQWIDEILDSSLKWRKAHPYFIIEMAKSGDNIGNNAVFCKFFNEFGLPFCTNDIYDGCFSHPKIQTSELQLDTFLAVGQISKLFRGEKDIACGLYNYCTKCQKDQTGDIIVDNRCSSAPWTRDKDARLCPYALLWRHWNLSGSIPAFE